jgi:FKBP-type peptidyl-prolyl cis-trans isomerase FklB
LLQIDEAQIMCHEADEPNALVDFFDSDASTGQQNLFEKCASWRGAVRAVIVGRREAGLSVRWGSSMQWFALVLASALGLSVGYRAEAAPADPVAQEKAFLAENAQKDGVIALPGLQYKVLKSGPADGHHPLRSDDVTVRYQGRFINGEVFNTSPDDGGGTTVFPLQKLIPGWIAALQLMRPGDVWMLYVPAYLAYGTTGKSYIPPNSTLIFRVALDGAGPPAAKPPAP